MLDGGGRRVHADAVAEGPAVLGDRAADRGLAVGRPRAVEQDGLAGARDRGLQLDHRRRRRVAELVGAEVAGGAGDARLAVEVGLRVAALGGPALVDDRRVGAQVVVAPRRADEERVGRRRLVGARERERGGVRRDDAEQAGVRLRRGRALDDRVARRDGDVALRPRAGRPPCWSPARRRSPRPRS